MIKTLNQRLNMLESSKPNNFVHSDATVPLINNNQTQHSRCDLLISSIHAKVTDFILKKVDKQLSELFDMDSNVDSHSSHVTTPIMIHSDHVLPNSETD